MNSVYTEIKKLREVYAAHVEATGDDYPATKRLLIARHDKDPRISHVLLAQKDDMGKYSVSLEKWDKPLQANWEDVQSKKLSSKPLESNILPRHIADKMQEIAIDLRKNDKDVFGFELARLSLNCK